MALRFPHQAYISKELSRYATALRKRKEEDTQPLPPTELSPALEKSVSAAYNAYSKDEWKRIIPKLNHADLRPLLLYLRDNKDQLTRAQVEQNDIAETERGDLSQRVSERAAEAWAKYGAVFDAAARRSMILLFSQGKWEATPISDPLWVAVWWEMSRKRTRELWPRPSKRRSWMEMASDRAVAESLGYDPDTMHGEVAKWRKRMKEVSLEQFVEKYGGDWTDYLTWVRNPPLHKKLQKQREQRGQ